MEDVREYFHLYLGCEVIVTTNQYGLQGPPNQFKGILRGYTLDQWKQQEFATALQVYISDTTYYFYKIEQVKLILRRLDSMTEEEIKKIDLTDRGLMLANFEMGNELNFTAKQFVYLLSKGFWLFGDEAFDKGLIIDSKTLNKEV